MIIYEVFFIKLLINKSEVVRVICSRKMMLTFIVDLCGFGKILRQNYVSLEGCKRTGNFCVYFRIRGRDLGFREILLDSCSRTRGKSEHVRKTMSREPTYWTMCDNLENTKNWRSSIGNFRSFAFVKLCSSEIEKSMLKFFLQISYQLSLFSKNHKTITDILICADIKTRLHNGSIKLNRKWKNSHSTFLNNLPFIDLKCDYPSFMYRLICNLNFILHVLYTYIYGNDLKFTKSSTFFYGL